MHRYERIEQMEREIEEICDNIPAEHCNISECHSCISAYLVDRGYRKASEVAREIFEEIEEGVKAGISALQFETNPIHRKVKHKTYSSIMRYIKTLEDKYESEGDG